MVRRVILVARAVRSDTHAATTGHLVPSEAAGSYSRSSSGRFSICWRIERSILSSALPRAQNRAMALRSAMRDSMCRPRRRCWRRLSLSIDAGRSSSATPLNPRIPAPNSLRRSGRGGLVDQLAGLGEEPAGALADLVHHALPYGVAHGLEGRRDDLTGAGDRVPDPLGGATRIADDVAQVTGRVEYPRTTAARNGRCPPAPVPARRDSAPW